jgi:chromosome segregation protein
MLKALELYGFKSFADKTRFVFPDGITVVVGPNGSGKSNVVDAMKWVLGEQSAKSLRGQEMADVIFKGTGGGSGTRKPANTAEVTIVFDNANRMLSVDAPEVRVTRRVYRSGEGEYLINGNPCRLRDVKDLFRGTGVGTDAYSLIEQGKVDTLLQASPRERRAIFEEAAGISRFKAKKVETQRRLERVEQNLARLSDIVEEVGTRLRTVQNQAAKARRYKEHTERLKQLRTNVGLVDWKTFTRRLDLLVAELETINAEHRLRLAELETSEAALLTFDRDAQQLADTVRSVEHRIAQIRQQIALAESTGHHQRKRMDEHEHEIARLRRQLVSVNRRAGDLGTQLEQVESQLAFAESQHSQAAAEKLAKENHLREVFAQLQHQRQIVARLRNEHHSLSQFAATLAAQVQTCESQLVHYGQSIAELEAEVREIDESRARADAEFANLRADEQRCEQQVAESRAAVDAERAELAARRAQQSQQQVTLVDVQKRHAVAKERRRVLEDLERRREGLSEGVRDVLEKARDAAVGPLTDVKGVVADLIRVEVDMAALIDAALGETSQYVVTTTSRLAEAIAVGEFRPVGRVGILSLDRLHSRLDDAQRFNLAAEPRVLGRADQFVEVDEVYRPLARQLLESTWCVETLSVALKLSALSGAQHRFVTLHQEVVDYDGSVRAGPRQSGTGIVSRRSELRSLTTELVGLEEQSQRLERELAELSAEVELRERRLEEAVAAHDTSRADLTECQLRTQAARERCDSLNRSGAAASNQLSSMRVKHQQCCAAKQDHERSQTETTARMAQIEEDLAMADGQFEQLERTHEEAQRSQSLIQVELAKCEQRVDDLRSQLIRCQEDQLERDRAIQDLETQLAESCGRLQGATASVLSATSELALLYVKLQSETGDFRELAQRQTNLGQQRSGLVQQVNEARRVSHQLEQDQHRHELEANQIRHERDTLVQRVQEDYAINLAELVDHATTDADTDTVRDRAEIDREIAELRRKISNVGAVNLAALDEIDELQQRHESLASQYKDLVDAKNSLVHIIQRINADSRRLFTETLESIRANFQRLFRRVFGGGHADIVLEEGLDILEAGIEIIATPPGKHSLGISLLSGGERALTAVTLLLAIFEYRPSPFCVLDEVDGPLDEANIGRFTDVLRDFLAWTKFIIVTHSKKTMTAAMTLYGITMQESGVSKQVSVQFDDVSDDGQIRREAVERSDRENRLRDDERGVA